MNWGRDVHGSGHGLLKILAQHSRGKTENNHKKVNECRSSPGLQGKPELPNVTKYKFLDQLNTIYTT
jgi:hypothetical protein